MPYLRTLKIVVAWIKKNPKNPIEFDKLAKRVQIDIIETT
jgi:hypothetical protein